jgi:hypothetical protein
VEKIVFSPQGSARADVQVDMNRAAFATYSILSSTEAFIEVAYPDGGFGMERVTKPRNGSLYEAAYSAASIKASIQGLRLERFTKA